MMICLVQCGTGPVHTDSGLTVQLFHYSKNFPYEFSFQHKHWISLSEINFFLSISSILYPCHAQCFVMFIFCNTGVLYLVFSAQNRYPSILDALFNVLYPVYCTVFYVQYSVVYIQYSGFHRLYSVFYIPVYSILLLVFSVLCPVFSIQYYLFYIHYTVFYCQYSEFCNQYSVFYIPYFECVLCEDDPGAGGQAV